MSLKCSIVVIKVTEISKICPRSWGSSPGGCGHCGPDCDIIIKVYRGIINYSLISSVFCAGSICCVITNSRCLQTNMNSNHNLMSFAKKFLQPNSSSQHLAFQIFLQKFLFLDIILLFIMFLSVKRFAMKARANETNEKSVYLTDHFTLMAIPASVHDTIPIADPCCFQCRSCNPRRFPHQERSVCLQLKTWQ